MGEGIFCHTEEIMVKRGRKRPVLYLTRDLLGAFVWEKKPVFDDGVFIAGDGQTLQLPSHFHALIPYEQCLEIDVKEAAKCTFSKRTSGERRKKPTAAKSSTAGVRKLAVV